MDMTPFLGFLLASLVGLFLSFFTFLLARKAGVSPAQTTLIATLKDNAEALSDQVRLLKEQVEAETRERERLHIEVDRLKEAVSDLAVENALLRKRLGMASREDF